MIGAMNMGTMKGNQAAMTVYLLPEVLDALKLLSKRTSIPVNALMREAVDALLVKREENVAIREPSRPGRKRPVSKVTKLNRRTDAKK